MVKGSYFPRIDHTIAAPLEFMNAGTALAWYKNILGAEEQMRFQRPDKKVIYAEMSIGDSMFYLDKVDTAVSGIPGRLHVFVEDVDKTLKKALRHGATLVKPAQDQLYGERCAWINDPFGYKWVLATRNRQIFERRRNVA
jgi:uncharacterized glyoxalase superfamily protein PhnB